MSAEEERLRRLLQSAVPEPPVQISAAEVTASGRAGRRGGLGSGRRGGGQAVRSWTVPALAAAAVVAVGLTIGTLAAHHAESAGAAGGTGTLPPGPTAQLTPTCQGASAVVPNVLGTTLDAAGAIIQQAGLNIGFDQSVPSSGEAVPLGTVFAQSLVAGSRAVPGAEVVVAIAVAPPTSTAPAMDPGMGVIGTGTPAPTSPCQALPAGSPPAQGTDAPVPYVIGMGRAQAIAAASQAGFKPSVTVAKPPTGRALPPGIVFAQAPASGSTARPRSGMILYVTPAS